MIAGQLIQLANLLEGKSLQKKLKVVSLIDCTIEGDNIFLRKIIENIISKGKNVVVLRNEENSNDLKSINIIENNFKYLFCQNLFSNDIFKSKYNQEILKMSSVMNDMEFKNLDFILFDATNIFKKNVSKFLKISDNILILANTSDESLKKVVLNFQDGRFKNEKVNIVLIDNKGDLDCGKYFDYFKKNIKDICDIDIEILDLISEKFSVIELYKTGEKIYLNSMKEESKNTDFFNFVLNILN